MTYQSTDQINGSAAHQSIDDAGYTTASHILMGISVYSERYSLFGKIDLFDIHAGILRERKKKIKAIYDGQIFQLYAQYFALCEMGYSVKKICLYSTDDNKTYDIDLPTDNPRLMQSFENTVDAIRRFSFDGFRQENPLKCAKCIYEPLCPFSLTKE